jgi:hypothetical protein
MGEVYRPGCGARSERPEFANQLMKYLQGIRKWLASEAPELRAQIRQPATGRRNLLKDGELPVGESISQSFDVLDRGRSMIFPHEDHDLPGRLGIRVRATKTGTDRRIGRGEV